MRKIDELERDVLNKDLCTRCGTCVGVCPTQTISVADNNIVINKEKCINCNKCIEVCPGKKFGFDEWSRKICGAPYNFNSKFGNYIKVYKAGSMTEGIKFNAASGGVVTQICLDLLKTGKIEGVIAVREKKHIPYQFETFLAKSEEEIIKSSQSKYVVIPTNSILQLIREEKKRIAYIGLPCQVQGLRKAMEKEKWLEESIVVIISLFCGFNMEYEATEYLIKKSKIKYEDIVKLEYRHKNNGETGFYVKDRQEKEFFIPKHGYTFMNLIFSPKRCWQCFDYSGEFADISVGDAWEMKGGCSRVIVRTKKGKEVLEDCCARGSIWLEECDIENIIRTQKKVIGYKKDQIYHRKKYMKEFPDYGFEFIKTQNGWKALTMYMILAFFKTYIGKKLVRILPFRIMVYVSKVIKTNEVK